MKPADLAPEGRSEPFPVSGPEPTTDTPHTTPNAIRSEALLRGQPSVAIHHQGAVYRLQATRQGKLLLTK
jgi:hemin uptake protein HemP